MVYCIALGLLFSVNTNGQFVGLAEMIGPVTNSKDTQEALLDLAAADLDNDGSIRYASMLVTLYNLNTFCVAEICLYWCFFELLVAFCCCYFSLAGCSFDAGFVVMSYHTHVMMLWLTCGLGIDTNSVC